MPLKNYTSQVAAAQSIAYIERNLVQRGAKQIMKTYDPQGRVDALHFIIPINGHDVAFRLPARVDACERVLMADTSPRTKRETLKKIPEQAQRTAWKIASDWIEAQMAMIDLAQVEFAEVFLSYVYDPAKRQALYEQAKERGVAGFLPAPKAAQS